jgi:hypothetical protein
LVSTGAKPAAGRCQARQRRRRESRDRKVIAVGEHRQERERQQLEPEAAEALPIDQRLDGERRLMPPAAAVSVARIDPSPLVYNRLPAIAAARSGSTCQERLDMTATGLER